MKKLLVMITFFVVGLWTGAAYAGNYGEAEVIDIQPIYRTQYNRVCHDEYVTVDRQYVQQNTGNTVVGAIIGGAIGNQFGGGKGKDAMTVLGAIVGADVANRQNGNSITRQEVEKQTVCTQEPTRIQAGEVITFKYRGRIFTQTFND